MRKNKGLSVSRQTATKARGVNSASLERVLVLWLLRSRNMLGEFIVLPRYISERSVSQAVASIITGNRGVTAACRVTSSLIDTHWTHYPVLPDRSFISLKGYGIFHSFHSFVATDSAHIFSLKHDLCYSKSFNCNYLFNRTSVGQLINKYKRLLAKMVERVIIC